MNTLSEKFAARVREYRTQRELSQEKLALKADINVSFLGQIERGTQKPTIETIDKLLNALDVSYSEFFEYADNAETDIDFSIIDNITYELKSRTQNEQQYIYDVMQRFFAYNDNK